MKGRNANNYSNPPTFHRWPLVLTAIASLETFLDTRKRLPRGTTCASVGFRCCLGLATGTRSFPNLPTFHFGRPHSYCGFCEKKHFMLFDVKTDTLDLIVCGFGVHKTKKYGSFTLARRRDYEVKFSSEEV